MKRSLALAALAVFAATAAFAAVQDFGEFKADIPAGWTATQDGETVGIVKDDNTASMSITVDSTDGASAKEIAEAFATELKGKNLTASDEGYTFTFDNGNGVESKAFVVTDSGKYALIVVTGAENAPDDVAAIIGSLKQ